MRYLMVFTLLAACGANDTPRFLGQQPSVTAAMCANGKETRPCTANERMSGWGNRTNCACRESTVHAAIGSGRGEVRLAACLRLCDALLGEGGGAERGLPLTRGPFCSNPTAGTGPVKRFLLVIQSIAVPNPLIPNATKVWEAPRGYAICLNFEY
jgi:hypothetical protein